MVHPLPGQLRCGAVENRTVSRATTTWTARRSAAARTPVRLELEGPPDRDTAVWASPTCVAIIRLVQCVPRPAGLAPGCGDHRSTCSSDTVRGAPAALIRQPGQPISHEPGTPFTHHLRSYRQLRGHGLVCRALGTGQHDLGSQRQRLSALRPPRPPRQRLPLALTSTNSAVGRPTLAIEKDYQKLMVRINDSGH